MAKQKYYVVWHGKTPGIYNSWDTCKEQVHGFEGAKYISFEKKEEAEMAYKNEYSQYVGKNITPTLSSKEKEKYGTPIKESISVDGAWNTATGDIEYQGVDTHSCKPLFRSSILKNGTNNIAEFLAIVHALAYSREKNITFPIYSDSRNAIGWVKEGKCKTKLEKTTENREIFNLIERAEKWLQNNKYSNKILKWETKAWGENPADFGRK